MVILARMHPKLILSSCSKRQRKSYDFKPANTDTVMENSPVTSTAMLDHSSPGAEEDGGDSKMTEKEIEGLETEATSNF